ncbi:MAG TPA: ATP-binding protein [Rectinemataceae bacterium]|nr:ATP-binding protein [Rectinemataceae bacterium]
MKGRGAARDAASPGAGSGRRFLPDILSVFLVYLVSGTGFLLVAGFVIESSASSMEVAPPFLLLGVLPLATIVILAIQARMLLRSLGLRRYGARLRLKLAGIFLAFVVVTSIPQAWFALRMASLMAGRQASVSGAEGIDAAVRLVGEWQEDSAARLSSTARNRLSALLDAGTAPKDALATLQRSDPAIEALEIFGPGSRRLSLGPLGSRLASPPPPGTTGSLPPESRSGLSRLRYAIDCGDSVVILCLRLPPSFEASTTAMATGREKLRSLADSSSRWPSFIALVYLLFVLPLFLLALLLGMASADFLAEPLANLEEATRRIAAGDSSVRLLAKPGDERGWLLSSFNRMLDELEKGREGELMQERIDAWKDLAQRLAHELKNPLTPIRLASERLLRISRSDPEKARAITESTTLAIIAEVDGMDALLGDFREFARLPSPQKDWVPLEELLEESVAMYRHSYPEVDFSVGSIPSGLRLNVDRSMIRRALGNLVANSVEAMEGRGRVGFSADLVKAGDSGYCRLRLSDSGKGIPADVKDRVFMPYFTTKEKGTGLGLAIVERIIHDHGGRIRFESAEGLGTVFWLDLPVER